jgi:hypothetical protein
MEQLRTDVTVNVEGFWMLQALLDIRLVAPELRCRPYVSSGSTDGMQNHPGLAVLTEAGIVVDGAVRADIADRMRVLAAPDMDVVAMLAIGQLRFQTDHTDNGTGPRDIPSNEFRVVLSRRDEHWVSAVRVGTDITVDDVAIDDTASIAAILTAAIDSIHPADPAPVTAVNAPMDELLSATKEWAGAGFSAFSGSALRAMGLSAAMVAALGPALADPAAEAALYARQYRDEQTLSSPSVLNLKDGEAGRVALYRVAPPAGSHQDWMAICPATSQLIEVGVQTVLDTLPFGLWKTHRRLGN